LSINFFKFITNFDILNYSKIKPIRWILTHNFRKYLFSIWQGIFWPNMQVFIPVRINCLAEPTNSNGLSLYISRSYKPWTFIKVHFSNLIGISHKFLTPFDEKHGFFSNLKFFNNLLTIEDF